VMAVPSHSEVVGLVNLEAAAELLPTITTHQTGLFDWELGGGILIQPSVAELRASLEEVAIWSDDERHQRGLSSRELVLKRYSWKAVLPAWMSLYRSQMDS
jgi:glycosyltransferase involved in cell wall biosynthesis